MGNMARPEDSMQVSPNANIEKISILEGARIGASALAKLLGEDSDPFTKNELAFLLSMLPSNLRAPSLIKDEISPKKEETILSLLPKTPKPTPKPKTDKLSENGQLVI